MSNETQNLSIFFADITGSTKLYETLGDARARELTGQCMDNLCSITAKHGGRVIKTMGDGMLSVFPTADLSFIAAIEMQEAYEHHELSITIGFHFGSVIEENNDVFGDAVNLAARIAGKARPGETLLTKETVDLLSTQYRFVTKFLDTTTVKGKTEKINIFTIISEEDDEATVNLSSASSMIKQETTAPKISLVLNVAGKTVILENDMGSIAIGRGNACDLAIPSNFASRKHASIEKQRDRFVLTDQSTNGTYVLNQNNHETFLKRESMQLTGKGYISLGEKTNKESELVVTYEYKSE